MTEAPASCRGLFVYNYREVGSLRVVADAGGNVIKEVLYDPFGGIIEDSNPGLRIPIGYAGGLHDRDLGFVRFGWRDYDTFTSRLTAPDPLGDAGGDPDWYGYCLDDPVNGVDPMGLMGAVPYLSQLNRIGIAVAKELRDGRPGFVEAVSNGAKWYMKTVDANLDKMREDRKSIADDYRRKARKELEE